MGDDPSSTGSVVARVGLVLGAGGAVGHAFHAATLAALAEVVGWDARAADLVVGTSAGSVVGAMLRAGAGPVDLYRRAVGEPMSSAGEALFDGVTWPTVGPADAVGPRRFAPLGHPGHVFLRWLLHPGQVSPGAVAASALPPGRIPNDHVRDGIRRLFRSTAATWPDRPLWINTVRVGDGARVVFGRRPPSTSRSPSPSPGTVGSPASPSPPVAELPPSRAAIPEPAGAATAEPPVTDVGTAVAASCAIPGYYRPVRIGDANYVDGGWHSALNADLLAQRPLDLAIVCSPMTSLVRRPTRRPDLPMRAALGAQLERELRGLRRRGTPVVVFEPGPDELAVMGHNPLDAERRAPVARQVLAATRAALEEPGLAAALAPLRS